MGGSTNYILEISTSPTFSPIAYTANVAGTSHLVATPLSSDTLYYWRVRAAANICGSGANSAVWAFTTVGGPTTLPAICRNPGTAIPDNNTTGITDSMVIATTDTLTDLNVSMNIPHTWVGDLWITLTHVDTATTVQLLNRPNNAGGGCNGNNLNIILDSSAALAVQTSCANANPPYTTGGSYIPAATLNAFNGQNLSGTWQLRVSDRASQDLGTLNQWCLIPTVASTPAARDYSDLDTGYGVAWHTGDGALRLGSNWTADTTFTLGNDDGSDDGITQTGGQWTTGNTVTLNATITGGGGYLAGWFDWNNDGVFSAGEKAVAQNVVVGVNSISVTVGPYNPSSNSALNARFRLYDSEPLLGPTGIETPDGGAAAGEVEDYAWSFTPTAITLQSVGLSRPLAWGLGLVFGLVGMTGWVLWQRRQTR